MKKIYKIQEPNCAVFIKMTESLYILGILSYCKCNKFTKMIIFCMLTIKGLCDIKPFNRLKYQFMFTFYAFIYGQVFYSSHLNSLGKTLRNGNNCKEREKMSMYILEEDVYAGNGILLLSKGNVVTDETVAKLERYGIYILEKSNNAAPAIVSGKAVQTFKERKNIRNNCVLELPNKILNTIIFESKEKPWWIYVNALANYVDWLYTHSIDVAMISLMIAVELGFNDDALWDIGLGAFLHDIGKLLVPKSIIQKPGPLTDMEMVYVRQHCELGMSSIEPLCLPKASTDIILQHHERLDGSGYPKGLKGDEICLNAKIVMVADSVDAITSGRPYRQGLDIDEAGKMLKSDGEKYSPEIISVLEKILE